MYDQFKETAAIRAITEMEPRMNRKELKEFRRETKGKNRFDTLAWLESHRSDYDAVIEEVILRLASETRTTADAILRAAGIDTSR